MDAHGDADQRNHASSSLTPNPTVANPSFNHLPLLTNSNRRLQLDPPQDNYDDLPSEFHSSLFKALERYLPSELLNAPRETKHKYMLEILRRYSPGGDRDRGYSEYRKKILSNYQPLHRELYQLNAQSFFVPSFSNAIFVMDEATRVARIKGITSKTGPGVYTFDMLQPEFCEMLIAEVENFEKWADETKFRIMRPTTMNNYGVVLDDFGMENMLQILMEYFVQHISKVYFSDVGGRSLDSHHGFVVEYGFGRDRDLGFHVDDSEVTLNVCLGKQFSGGELYFRGVRCAKHVDSEPLPEEMSEISHVPGRAILHCGRHRYGMKPTTSGRMFNLVLWCKSALFREMSRNEKRARWCHECNREQEESARQYAKKRLQEMLLSEEEVAALDLR